MCHFALDIFDGKIVSLLFQVRKKYNLPQKLSLESSSANALPHSISDKVLVREQDYLRLPYDRLKERKIQVSQ